jgi:hypothetical protein
MDSTSDRGNSSMGSRLTYFPPLGPKAAAEMAAVDSRDTVSKTWLILPLVASRIWSPTFGMCWKR